MKPQSCSSRLNLAIGLASLLLLCVPQVVHADRVTHSTAGDEETFGANGYEMTYSLTTGQLLFWSGPGGEILLDRQTAAPPAAEGDVLDTETEPPLRLYLFRYIDDALAPYYQFVSNPFVVCEITEFDIDSYTYEGLTDGNWLYQTWRIYGMHGERNYPEFPQRVGVSGAETVTDNLCDFHFDGQLILTVSARQSLSSLYEGMQVFDDLHVVINLPHNPSDRGTDFGVMAVEWPLLKGMQGFGAGDAERLVYPKKDGLVLKNPLSILGTRYTTQEFEYLGDELPTLVTLRRPQAVSSVYPSGHGATMQFMSYFQHDTDQGYLWYADDTTFKAKTFVFEATGGQTFDLSFIHNNDDVCGGYDPDDGTLTIFPRYCLKNDFGPLPYAIDMVFFSYTEGGLHHTVIDGNWRSVAAYYRDWVRDSDAAWVQHPALAERTDAFVDFYKYTGFAVYNAGSEFALGDPLRDGRGSSVTNDDNFLQAYRDILYSWPSRPLPKVNYILGWDFHHAGRPQRGSNWQNGKCIDAGCNYPFASWLATFGPLGEGEKGDWTDRRLNMDVVLGRSGGPVLGYLNPFFFGLSMHHDAAFSWTEWTQNWGETVHTPWQHHRNYPHPVTSLTTFVMDPTQDDFFDHYFDRNEALVFDPLRTGNPGGNNAISGVYQDIGVTFAAPAAFRSHPESGTDVEEHRAGSALTELGGFVQVGTGGFVWDAQRQMVLQSREQSGPNQRFLLGTEQMTELFIDAFDFYHLGENGLGPVRPCDGVGPIQWPVVDDDDDDSTPVEPFSNWNKWIMEGDAREIPLMQFVYHPMMPVRHGIVLLSGGGDVDDDESNYDFGDIFYWITAREYIEFGGAVELGYHDVELDVLTDNGGHSFLPAMDSNTPSYQLGWGRASEYSEEEMGDGIPGRHPVGSGERTIGDPNKELFLRLMAAVRSYFASEFLVTGEMRENGASLENAPAAPPSFDYDWYGQRALGLFTDDSEWEHYGEFTDTLVANQRIVFNTWQDYDANDLPGKVLIIAANLYDAPKTFTMRLPRVDEFLGTDYKRIMKINPTTANFSTLSQGTLTAFTQGTYTDFTVSNVPAHGVALILVCDVSSGCTFQ